MKNSNSLPGDSALRTRLIVGLALFVLVALIFQESLRKLVILAANDEHYTHILLVPATSLVVLFLYRGQVFRKSSLSPTAGLPWIIAGAGLQAGALLWPPPESSGFGLSLAILALVLIWLGVFTIFFGTAAFVRAWFPLTFLFLFVPLPFSWVNEIQGVLQQYSADLTHVIFSVFGMPVLREGLVFSLPGVQIEVAPECSGIRSSMALLMSSLLLGHLFLRTPAQKVLLLLVTIPLMIVKNAIRIATLSFLGVYVSRDYLVGDLHHRGGLVFFLIAMILLVPVLLVLHRLGPKLLRNAA